SRYFFVAPFGSEGGAAPSPPPTRTIRICGPPTVCFCSGPKSFPQLRREPISQRDAPRALLRPKPIGRSLITVSPLLSKPVVMLYGSADVAWKTLEIVKPIGKRLL